VPRRWDSGHLLSLSDVVPTAPMSPNLPGTRSRKAPYVKEAKSAYFPTLRMHAYPDPQLLYGMQQTLPWAHTASLDGQISFSLGWTAFDRRTGTAGPMALRTRIPMVFAMASSLRRCSCSARQQFGQLSGIYAVTVLRPGFGQNVSRLEIRSGVSTRRYHGQSHTEKSVLWSHVHVWQHLLHHASRLQALALIHTPPFEWLSRTS
jgi:hypothetical protein